MEIKVITKKVNDRLDSFLKVDKPAEVNSEQKTSQNRKVLKKNDGLIERVDISKKMYITEDNRELLND